MDKLLLRLADVADEEFLKDLFFDVRHVEFEAVGMPLEQVKLLLGMQFTVQKQSYSTGFPNARHEIIEFESKRIGRIITHKNGGETHLIDISILSEFRLRGFGSFLIEKLKTENNSVSLSVYKANTGAVQLYERHGFNFTGEDGMYYQMEWKNA